MGPLPAARLRRAEERQRAAATGARGMAGGAAGDGTAPSGGHPRLPLAVGPLPATQGLGTDSGIPEGRIAIGKADSESPFLSACPISLPIPIPSLGSGSTALAPPLTLPALGSSGVWGVRGAADGGMYLQGMPGDHRPCGHTGPAQDVCQSAKQPGNRVDSGVSPLCSHKLAWPHSRPCRGALLTGEG